MNRRALLVALVLASMGASLLFFYLRRFEQEASGGDKVRLLSTTKTIDRGGIITDDSLAMREIPQAYVEDRAVKAIDRTKVVGLRVGSGLAAQQTLLWTDLAVANEERRDLSGLIQPGSRGASFRAAGDDKSFALLHPGDYIDVIATMQNGERDGARVAILLLQRVLVLAVGLDTEAHGAVDGSKTSTRDLILTVSVSLQEGQLLALAIDKGRLSVMIRNPGDARTVENFPDMLSTALGDMNKRQEVGKSRGTVGPTKLGVPAAGAPK